MAMRKSKWEQEHEDARAAGLREVESFLNTLGVPIIDYSDDAHHSLWDELFLLYYSHTNNVQESCDRAGIKRSTLKRAMALHPEFAERVREAGAMAVDRVEFVLMKLALSGDMDAIKTFLKGHRRDRFGDKQQIEVVEVIKPEQMEKMTMEQLREIAKNRGRLLPPKTVEEEIDG